MNSEELIVALDIGTLKLKILVAQIVENEIEVIASFINNLKSVKTDLYDQIRDALNTLEKDIHCSLEKSFYIFSVSDDLIEWKTYSSKMQINDGVVKQLHMIRAKKEFLESDNKLCLTSVYRNCIVDNNRCVPNPVGVKTSSLTFDGFIACWKNQNTLDEYEKLIKKFSTNRILVYPTTLCLPYTYQKDNEPTLFIDLGANRVNYLFFRLNLIGDLGSYEFGINSIIKDLSIGLNLPISLCRDIIEKDLPLIYKDNSFYKCIGKNNQQRYIPHISIKKIIESRFCEICNFIKKAVKENDSNFDYDKIIFTGGGANLKSLFEIAKATFNKPIFSADFLPKFTTKNKLAYSTALGLLCYFILYLEEKPVRDNAKTILGKIRRFFED